MNGIKEVLPLSFLWPTLDPFLFCAHHNDAYPAGTPEMAPKASLAGRAIGQDFSGKDGFSMYHGQTIPGFPQHPHRGFETVTLVRHGLIDHSDSSGATARFGQGDVQWLTAGAGIVHSEMFPLVNEDEANPTELFQLWLNLPKKNKMVAPHFSMIWAPEIPRVVVVDDGGNRSEVRVVAGAFGETAPPAAPPKSWASEPDANVAIWTLRLEPNAKLTIPKTTVGTNRFLYFFAGETLKIGPTSYEVGKALLTDPEADLFLENGAKPSELLLLQGKPIGEPVVQYGPFVMNTKQEIQQAFTDYQRTQFGGWPFPSDAPAHPRTQGRFARHSDGRLENGPTELGPVED